MANLPFALSERAEERRSFATSRKNFSGKKHTATTTAGARDPKRLI